MHFLDENGLINPEEKSGKNMANTEPVAPPSVRGSLASWKKKVLKSTTTYYRRAENISEYMVRIQCGLQREWIPLGTVDLNEAAAKARDFYFFVRANGWVAGLAKFKPQTKTSERDLTVGNYFELVRLHAGLKPMTFSDYCRCFRGIAGEILRLKHEGAEKYGIADGKSSQWRLAIEKRPLAFFTPAKVAAWRSEYVAARSSNYVEKRRAEHTANSKVRGARSLFTEKIMNTLPPVVLPAVLPFHRIFLLPEAEASFHYKSEVDAGKLLDAAFSELRTDRPELFLIFLLALGGGLRRNEIDKLRWVDVLPEENAVSITAHEFFEAKTDEALTKVYLEPKLMAELVRLRPSPCGG